MEQVWWPYLLTCCYVLGTSGNIDMAYSETCQHPPLSAAVLDLQLQGGSWKRVVGCCELHFYTGGSLVSFFCFNQLCDLSRRRSLSCFCFVTNCWNSGLPDTIIGLSSGLPFGQVCQSRGGKGRESKGQAHKNSSIISSNEWPKCDIFGLVAKRRRLYSLVAIKNEFRLLFCFLSFHACPFFFLLLLLVLRRYGYAWDSFPSLFLRRTEGDQGTRIT